MRFGLFVLVSVSAFTSALAQAPPLEPESGPRYPETSAREEPVRRIFPRRNVWVTEYEPNSLEKQLLAPSIEDRTTICRISSTARHRRDQNVSARAAPSYFRYGSGDRTKTGFRCLRQLVFVFKRKARSRLTRLCRSAIGLG